MKKIILSIDGMTCSACSNGLEKYLNKQKGINSASVNLVMANASIEYDEKVLNIDDLNEFVKQAGFISLGEYKDIKLENKSKKEKVKFIIFTILAILLMYISMGHMIKLPTIPFLDPHTNPINYTVSLAILTVCFLWYGLDILKNGYKNLIHLTPNMDTLVGIGVLASLGYSIYNMILVFMGNSHQVMNLYFESAAIVIYFIKLGRYIDGISKDKTKEAIKKLVQVTPEFAILKVENEEKKVTLDQVNKGDILIAKPGEKIAVDGEVTFGKTHLDESFITGESKPVVKNVGDKVIAGSINYDGYIEYKAEKIGKESTISEIVRLVIEASNTKVPIAKIADKVSGIFVPLVILIAVITLIVYLILGQTVESAIITFVTVLVVACPCSLGLATPLAVVVAEGLCASKGIVIKKSEILEKAQKIDTVILDKTGTLTYGKLKIAEVINYSDLDKDKVLQIAGSVELKSTHPIAKAFTDYLTDNKIEKLDIQEFENLAGLGLKANIGNDEILIGNAKILEKYGIENTHKADEEKLSKSGNSIVYFVKNKEVVALIGINDILRENAKEVISILDKRGIETIMLTGDNENTAQNIAQSVGISKVIANVMPSGKADTIKKLKAEGKNILMCGDGINDSVALTASDIGVSVNNATDIAMDSSDVILTRNDLMCIIDLMNISKKTITNIKQNLFWAFFYNSLMIPIAIGVLKPFGIAITPMIASLAMILSSITVILNALRIRR